MTNHNHEDRFQVENQNDPNRYFTQICNIVSELNLSPIEFRLYFELCKHANQKGASWYRNKELADKCNVSLHSIQRAKQRLSEPFKELGDKPLIKIENRYINNQQSSDVIIVQNIMSININYYDNKFQKKIDGVPQRNGGGATKEPRGCHKGTQNKNHYQEPIEQLLSSSFSDLPIRESTRRKLDAKFTELGDQGLFRKRLERWNGKSDMDAACLIILRDWNNWKDTPSKAEIAEEKAKQEEAVEKERLNKLAFIKDLEANYPLLRFNISYYSVTVRSRNYKDSGAIFIDFNAASFYTTLQAEIENLTEKVKDAEKQRKRAAKI